VRTILAPVTLALLAVGGCAHPQASTTCRTATASTCNTATASRTDSVCQGGTCETRPSATATLPIVAPILPGTMPYVGERSTLPAPPSPVTPPAAATPAAPATPLAPATLPLEIQRTLPDAIPVPKVEEPAPPVPNPPVQGFHNDAGTLKIGSPTATIELVGAVHAWRKTWRLCYASPDREDPNGGRVTLIGDPGIERLTEGKIVRARGFLMPATDRNSAPQFHVESLEVFE